MENKGAAETASSSGSKAWIAYVAPMALFMLYTALLEARFPGPYMWLYIGKVVLVMAALVVFRSVWKDIRFEARVLPMAILVGVVVFIEWIALTPLTPELSFLGKRAEFNPFQAIPDPAQRGLFLAFRFFGLAVMVPIMEELFWRSFLLRYLTDPDYERLPLGAFSWTAFGIVAAAFGFVHPEWLPALLCAVAYGLLLKQTRSLFACVVAHGVTNLALGIYVLMTGQWRYW